MINNNKGPSPAGCGLVIGVILALLAALLIHGGVL